MPAGFMPDVVSSTSPSNFQMSPSSGFSSQHPLLYDQRPSGEDVEQLISVEEKEHSLHQKSAAPPPEIGKSDYPLSG